MNLLTKTVPLFLVLFTALASGCNNLQLTECNESKVCTWCAFSNKEGKQSGHCLINLIADKLPSGLCGGVLEEEYDDDDELLLHKEDDDDDGDELLLRKEDDDDGDELLLLKEDGADVTYPGPKHNHPGPRDRLAPIFFECLTLDVVACDSSDICGVCVLEDPIFKLCLPKQFFSLGISDVCENGELTPSPSLADELDGCAVHESENLCAQSKGTADDSCVWCGSDVDGACVEASYVA